MVCHYWLFNHGFKFQHPVCNGCHDLTMLCLNLSDLTIYFTRYVHKQPIKMFSLHYHELMSKTEEHDGKKYLMVDEYILKSIRQN